MSGIARVVGERRKPVFLHLAINFEGTDGTVQREAVEVALNKAKDWLRYAPNCWIVYTIRSASSWAHDLKELPGMKDQTFFMAEINIKNRAGWMYKSTWDWINQQRDQA